MTSAPGVEASGAASVPPAVLTAVKVGRIWLVRAQFGLADDHGLACAMLDDLAADVAELLANWHGRARPPDPDVRRLWNPCDPASGTVPEWIATAAVDWRRRRDRTWRR